MMKWAWMDMGIDMSRAFSSDGFSLFASKPFLTFNAVSSRTYFAFCMSSLVGKIVMTDLQMTQLP
jgi:hypothetical protein